MLGFNKRVQQVTSKSIRLTILQFQQTLVMFGLMQVETQTDGKMYGLRKAVHNLVKIKMQAPIVSNDDIRAETNSFNLIAAPGYPEMLDEMISLSTDRRNTAFVIGDTPSDLKQTQQALKIGQQTPTMLVKTVKMDLFQVHHMLVFTIQVL